MTKLRFHTEVTPAFLAETGRSADGFRRQDGEIIALCTEFELLYWPARAIYDGHRLQYRVSLYDRDLKTRIGVFDNARYPINDIAFHPSQPMMAIGTGSYDGGYMFEGDLWLWNWETGESCSLLGEFREVVQCRFVDNKCLAVTLRPRYEDEFEGKEDEAFNTYVGLIIDDFCNHPNSLRGEGDPRLDNLTPLDPKSLGFLSPPISVNERRQRFVDVIGEVNRYEERARVWDIHWLPEDQIAFVHDNCHVEVWNTNGKREYRQVGEGFGVQILNASEGPLVHVVCRANYLDQTNDRSTLFRLGATGLRQLHSFDRAVVLSCDRSGNILCRDTGNEFGDPKRVDQILTSELSQAFAGDLGHYDCFNHYIRLDGGDGLYFLRGTPKSSHENKRLCRLNLDGSVDIVMDWDSHDSHLMEGTGCWGPENSLIRSFKIYDPHPNDIEGAIQIQRCNMKTGQVLWTSKITALVTSMTMINNNALAYGLTDGTLGVLDVLNGTILFEEYLAIDGISTIPTALAANGSQLAIGTIDGRLILGDLEM